MTKMCKNVFYPGFRPGSFFAAKRGGHGGYFICDKCHQKVYFTKKEILKKRSCICDECDSIPKVTRKYKNAFIPDIKQNTINGKYCYIKIKIIRVQKVKNIQHVINSSHIIIKKRKELILNRGQMCEICGRLVKVGKYLHMHHINRRRSDNKDDNLLLLCATCHLNQHLDNRWVCNVLGKQSKNMEREIFSEFC